MTRKPFAPLAVALAGMVALASCDPSETYNPNPPAPSGGSTTNPPLAPVNEGGGGGGGGSGAGGGGGGSGGVPANPNPNPSTPTPDAGTPAGNDGTPDAGTPTPTTPTMSFFVTSRGKGTGGDLRANPTELDGLAGADALCKQLAGAVSPALGAKTWRAYLSTTTVNARDRIGTGPWRNSAGVIIANSLAQLHEEGGLTNAITLANATNEMGQPIPRNPLVHDILTGTLPNGTRSPDNCSNWTSALGTVRATVGHSDRQGGASPSWNSVHTTGGCTEAGNQSIRTGGGRGSLFCFSLEQ
jgi:hypothetical protein